MATESKMDGQLRQRRNNASVNKVIRCGITVFAVIFTSVSSNLRRLSLIPNPPFVGRDPHPSPERNIPGLSFEGAVPCYDQGAAFAAAWLVRKETLISLFALAHRDVQLNYKRLGSPGWSARRANPEGASGMIFQAVGGGRVLQTVDAFEFLVEHWSIYERRLRLKKLVGGLLQNTTERVMRVVKRRERALFAAWSMGVKGGFLGDSVIAVMPFYAAGIGSGGSITDTRFLYLNATFFSVSSFFRHVVVMVSNEADWAYCAGKSGLPFFDVVLIDDLPNPMLLPVATVLETQQRFRTKEWDRFAFAYYTESDQVLHLRPHQLGNLLDLVAKNDSPSALVPHRFLPFPRPSSDFDVGFMAEIMEVMNRSAQGVARELHSLDAKRLVEISDEAQYRCCFDRGECRTRDHWVSFYDNKNSKGEFPNGSAIPEVHLFRFGNSAAMLNGEGNVLKKLFRTCAIQKGGNCTL